MNGQRIVQRLAPWGLPLLLLAVWQLSVSAGWLSTRILPAPSAVIEAGVSLVRSGDIWTHLAISGWRAGLGFVIGGGIGLALGFITGLSKWGERLLDSSVQMIRNVPHLALIPLVILWFGIDESAKIFLVALGTLFPIYLNTYHGIRNVDPALVEMARSYGLSGFALFRQVILPGALPSILVGVRFALGFMWLTLIVAETISASSGIGYLAMNAREFLQTDVVVLAIVLYAVLGKLADLAARGWSGSGCAGIRPTRSPKAVPNDGSTTSAAAAGHSPGGAQTAKDLRLAAGAAGNRPAHSRRPVRGGGGAQRLRQKYLAAPAGRSRPAKCWRTVGRFRALERCH